MKSNNHHKKNHKLRTDQISIRGAAEHNLQHIDLDIPRNQLIVFTGVSGSGKSSLAFDTIYAEGQRRYVESLSAYARQFLGQMEKPKVESISGLSPAIAIEQKSTSKNPRSTVGTITEIYDYFRVIYARVGRQHCHQCGRPVGAQSLEQILARIAVDVPDGARFLILSPQIQDRKGEYKEVFDDARKAGFVRVRVNGQVRDLDEDISLDRKLKHNVEVVVDRLVKRDDIESRLSESVEAALSLGQGTVIAAVVDGPDHFYSENNACVVCGISFPELSPQSFSFNSPLGRCPVCDGLGRRLEVDPDLVVPHKEYSIRQGALVPWRNLFEKAPKAHYAKRLRRQLETVAKEYDFSLDTAFENLTRLQQNVVLYGSTRPRPGIVARNRRAWTGILPEMEYLWRNTTSDGFRGYILENFIHQVPCPDCKGGRLRPESQAVQLGGRALPEVVALSIRECHDFFEALELSDSEREIASEVQREITTRLRFLVDVGLHYLTLDRNAPTLSGGEAQRIRLASQIGSGLTGVLYVLDEPSIGLHQRDNRKLLGTLAHLRDLGNTVLVVEHDEETIREADYVVDFGPGAGKRGGQVVFQGTPKQLVRCKESLTGQYLAGKCSIPTPEERRVPTPGDVVEILGASENNLKDIDVSVPLGLFTCVTGVSGSGKSSLVIEILYKALARRLHDSREPAGAHRDIRGLELLDKVIDIDQRPIGRTPRSNPATYVKVFDPIRYLFAELPEAKVRGYKPGRFSFNVKGGRCEACQGAGVKRIEMHFLADVYVTCDVCGGRRFNRETLQVKYKGLDIHQVLALTVAEALEVFEAQPRIRRILDTLHAVGLDYVQLGQPAPTLSGGEAQRVKLARELCKVATGRTLYILDEPTTGLHFDDTRKLLDVLTSLVERGNTVVVIEHNLDVIKCADYIIDLGPEGGDAGGTVVAVGSPEEIAERPESFTGHFLAPVLFGREVPC